MGIKKLKKPEKELQNHRLAYSVLLLDKIGSL
jgi:hypothetical protein